MAVTTFMQPVSVLCNIFFPIGAGFFDLDDMNLFYVHCFRCVLYILKEFSPLLWPSLQLINIRLTAFTLSRCFLLPQWTISILYGSTEPYAEKGCCSFCYQENSHDMMFIKVYVYDLFIRMRSKALDSTKKGNKDNDGLHRVSGITCKQYIPGKQRHSCTTARFLVFDL